MTLKLLVIALLFGAISNAQAHLVERCAKTTTQTNTLRRSVLDGKHQGISDCDFVPDPDPKPYPDPIPAPDPTRPPLPPIHV